MNTNTLKYRRKGGFALMALAFGLAMALIVMLLWNWLMPMLFGFITINYLQAIGLLILSKILFGGFCRKGGHHSHHPFWRKRFLEKWENLSDEEKEKYRSCIQPK